MIAIIDYGLGNLRSVQKALEKVGAVAEITHDASVVIKANKIVLPGVGAIAPAMAKLHELNLVDVIKESVGQGKPFLGICVGFQLLFNSSNEGGDVKALGIIPGTVQKFEGSVKVPQMGWNQIDIHPMAADMYRGIDNLSNVYFCHSFYAKPTDDSVSATKTDYGISYTSSVKKDNVWGVQFHPEKSQKIGLQLLENFVQL